MDLSQDNLRALTETLTRRFSAEIDREAFALTCEGDDEGLVLTCRLARDDRRGAYTVEVHSPVAHFENRTAARDEAVDAVGYVVEQYFSSGREVIPPLDWQPFSFGGPEVYIRGDLKNELLEDAADQLLAQDALPVDAEEP